MPKIVFLDLETTGFSREWNQIIEVAAILYQEETGEELGRFHEYIRPMKGIPAKITEITGITNEKVKYCRDEMSVLMDFYEWLFLEKPEKVCGHNYKSFDKSFLVAKANKYGISYPEDMEEIDTLHIARKLSKEGKLSVPNHQQPTLANFFGITYQAHSAIEDVRALIRIYEKLGLNKSKKQKRSELGF